MNLYADFYPTANKKIIKLDHKPVKEMNKNVAIENFFPSMASNRFSAILKNHVYLRNTEIFNEYLNKNDKVN